MIEITNGFNSLTEDPLSVFINTGKRNIQLDLATILVDFSEAAKTFIEGEHDLDKSTLIAAVSGDNKVASNYYSIIYLAPEDFEGDIRARRVKGSISRKVLSLHKNLSEEKKVLIIVDNCDYVDPRALRSFKNNLGKSEVFTESKSKVLLLSTKVESGWGTPESSTKSSLSRAVEPAILSFNPAKTNLSDVTDVISEFCQLYTDLTGDCITIGNVYHDSIELGGKK